MDILVCIKRIPDISGQITLDESGRDIDGSGLGHTTSAHEECAVELAIQTAAATGGSVTVLTLGPAEAVDQLRAAVGVGANDAILIEAEDPGAFGPEDIAQVIGDVVRDRADQGQSFDLVMLGNDAADTGDFQVPIRLAYDLDYPVLTGIQTLSAHAAGGSGRPAGSGGSGAIEAHGIGLAG
ncbi:electron transfer flavoprotein subunit beta/FixA family protein, partial [Brevibacterium sp.]|uniref:electron transfer flavoprotein subunit beta/FixA family protein n=1 Tax=Brevibacterium sp. TaxID=1701 RepID=UPI0026485094